MRSEEAAMRKEERRSGERAKKRKRKEPFTFLWSDEAKGAAERSDGTAK